MNVNLHLNFVGGLKFEPMPALIFGNVIPPWALMWLLALAIFLACKWLTWRQCEAVKTTPSRQTGYFFAWPGLDAKAFLERSGGVPQPRWSSWIAALLKMALGVALTWILARLVPPSEPLVRGWCGLVGLVFVLHFGLFDLLAVAWRHFGVNAQPIMRWPIMATSLADFWGHRWNAAFNRLAQDFVFRPLHRRIGAAGATMLAFLISGLIHELVISLPARGGYGLPTIYFLVQGAGLLFERSPTGRNLGLRRGLAGRAFMAVVTVGPVFWLFHPAFINRVIIPFLIAIHAL
jgi:hypothetical protein